MALFDERRRLISHLQRVDDDEVVDRQSDQIQVAEETKVKKAVPIASSVRHICSMKALVPSCCVLPFNSAIYFVAVPVEEGERCHVCDQSAVVQARHIAN